MGIAEDVGEDLVASTEGGRPHHNLRKLTFFQFVQSLGSVAGALIAIGLVVSWISGQLPFAMMKDVTKYQDKTDGRLGQIERTMTSIQIAQLQTIEIQLTDRVARLAGEIAHTSASSPDLQDKRHDQIEAQQRLDQTRTRITTLQQQRANSVVAP